MNILFTEEQRLKGTTQIWGSKNFSIAIFLFERRHFLINRLFKLKTMTRGRDILNRKPDTFFFKLNFNTFLRCSFLFSVQKTTKKSLRWIKWNKIYYVSEKTGVENDTKD